MSPRTAAFAIATSAFALLVWWQLPATGQQVDLPTAPSASEATPSTEPPILPQANTELCVEALRSPSVVEIRPAGDGAESAKAGSQSAPLRSYGKLDSQAKAAARQLQERAISGGQRRLQSALEINDMKQAARITESIGVAKQILTMLERDDYLLLDSEVVDRLWPASPDGWTIVRAQSIQLESGPRPTLVFAIRNSDSEFAKSLESAGNIEWFLAEDAAFRFNSLPDDQRSATLAAMDKWNRDESLDSSEKQRLAVLDPILKDCRLILEHLHVDIDRAQLLIRLSKR